MTEECSDPESVVARISALAQTRQVPDFLAEVANAEWRLSQARPDDASVQENTGGWQLNPTIDLLETQWNTAELINSVESGGRAVVPFPTNDYTMIWHDPRKGQARIKSASQEELFVLKCCAEQLTLQEAADTAGLHPDAVHNAFCRARNQELLLGFPSRLTRGADFCAAPMSEDASTAHNFVLQWHITHACDLHCKHCYDRSKRSPMSLEQGMDIIDQFGEFCRTKNVGGHICFSGGNPLMSPHFFELYQEAARRGHDLSILGNPSSRENLERIREIKAPSYYQVSLEGLPEHNDHIRGAGFFARVIEFLGLLRDLDIRSGVMLTLTRDNLDQVLDLGERLRGHAEQFTFNRLSPVGEGATLAMPDKQAFETLLRDYHAASRSNPILRIKDNLFNIVRDEQGQPPFDGCTGFGCGAAFNFVALLPDGEVHACRKFPSLIGNAFTETFLNIYDSQEAQKYRVRPDECRECRLAPTCGGCLAVTSGMGQDFSMEKDPFCWHSPAQTKQRETK